MMRSSLRCLAVLLLTGLLAACAGAGGRLQEAGGVAVYDLRMETSLDWARIRGRRSETWTIDGTPLNQLTIIDRVRDGEHVFLQARERRSRPDGAWFRTGMRPDEVQDLVLDALRANGWADLEASGLRPQRLGAVPGLRFEFSLSNQRGLHYRGMAAAAERGGRLTLLVWMAPSEHYFGRDQAAVAAMFDSLRFVD